MSFDPKQIEFLNNFVTRRNKSLRHEVSDHIDRALPVVKLQGDSENATSELVSLDGTVEWAGRMAAATTYIGVYHYIPASWTAIGSISFTPATSRKIRVAFSGSIANYGSGMTLTTSFKFQIAGVDYTTAVSETTQNNLWSTVSHEFLLTPIETQIGSSLTVDLLAITGAHPAIGTTDMRLIAHEV